VRSKSQAARSRAPRNLGVVCSSNCTLSSENCARSAPDLSKAKENQEPTGSVEERRPLGARDRPLRHWRANRRYYHTSISDQ
jgi:hypothetical protein